MKSKYTSLRPSNLLSFPKPAKYPLTKRKFRRIVKNTTWGLSLIDSPSNMIPVMYGCIMKRMFIHSLSVRVKRAMVKV